MKVKTSISNTKRYKHSLMCTNSTTGNFKDVQPLFCRMLMPNSKIDLSLDSFVRLAPLVFPTFGRLTSRYLAKFVPFEQIFPQMATFLSGLPVNLRTYQGVYNAIPQISNFALWQILTQTDGLKGFAIAQSFQNITPSSRDASHKTSNVLRRMPLDEFSKRFEQDIRKYVETRTITPDMFVINDTLDDDGNVIESHQYLDTFTLEAAIDMHLNGLSLADAANKWSVPTNMARATEEQMTDFEKVYNSADFVNVLSNSSSKVITTYRLTERGRMLRKIFIGLGYQPSKSDKTTMSILPILAFYKAYFDAFYPKRLQNFADTWCYKFIDSCTLLPQITEGQYIYHGANYPSTSSVKPFPTATPSQQAMYQSVVNNFTEFVKHELSLCYSTHDMDFFSLQTADINGNAVNMFDVDKDINTNSLGTILHSNELRTGSGRDENNSVDPLTTNTEVPQPTLVPNGLTSWSISLLQRLQNAVNRNSLIGRNVERFVRSHYNSDVYNELYLSSRSVGSGSYDVSISDITSTAQTSTKDAKGNSVGDNLGAYAGKGIGNGGMSVNFKADTFGYLIVLQWFEVETGYYFGTDPQHFYCGRLDMPNSEYDALGYEITPRSACWTDNNISFEGTDIFNVIGTNKAQLTIDNSCGFGFIPRFSRFKTSHNVVNGDFSRHGQINALSPFFLDRKPVVRYLDFSTILGPSNDKRLVGVFRELPFASAEWQYNSRYDWLNDYNRVFYNGGSASFKNGIVGGILDDKNDIVLYGVADNMLLHNVVRWTEINTLKPLAQSYDTQVGDDNAPTDTTPA